jgi:hypothetical protein
MKTVKIVWVGLNKVPQQQPEQLTKQCISPNREEVSGRS